MSSQEFLPTALTRRAFLGTGAAAGLYCLSPGRADAAIPHVFDGSQFKLQAPEPNVKHGGVLKYGVLSAPAHFDVHQSGTCSNMCTQGAMYDNLVRRNPLDSGKTIIPDLAHSWEIAKDGKTYTFFLRKGVTFHDGAELTAADVKATFDRIRKPPKGISIPRTPLFASVSAINARAHRGAMYDNLVRRNPLDSGKTIIPDLAHSWEIAKDGKTYTFFLRKGVTFHDGAELTAADVKATFDRIRKPPKGISIPRYSCDSLL